MLVYLCRPGPRSIRLRENDLAQCGDEFHFTWGKNLAESGAAAATDSTSGNSGNITAEPSAMAFIISLRSISSDILNPLFPDLSQHFPDDLSTHISQPKLPAHVPISQFLVVHTQAMQHGRL